MAGFPNPLRLAASWIVHRWAKSRGYVTLTPPIERGLRQFECDNCPASDFGQGFECADCNCILFAKQGLALESCPRKKWGRVWIKK